MSLFVNDDGLFYKWLSVVVFIIVLIIIVIFLIICIILYCKQWCLSITSLEYPIQPVPDINNSRTISLSHFLPPPPYSPITPITRIQNVLNEDSNSLLNEEIVEERNSSQFLAELNTNRRQRNNHSPPPSYHQDVQHNTNELSLLESLLRLITSRQNHREIQPNEQTLIDMVPNIYTLAEETSSLKSEHSDSSLAI